MAGKKDGITDLTKVLVNAENGLLLPNIIN